MDNWVGIDCGSGMGGGERGKGQQSGENGTTEIKQDFFLSVLL